MTTLPENLRAKVEAERNLIMNRCLGYEPELNAYTPWKYVIAGAEALWQILVEGGVEFEKFDEAALKKFISDEMIGVDEAEFSEANNDDAALIYCGARWQYDRIYPLLQLSRSRREFWQEEWSKLNKKLAERDAEIERLKPKPVNKCECDYPDNQLGCISTCQRCKGATR